MNVAEPRVLHVNHTAYAGGAELALARLLGQRCWTASVCAPPAGDAFDTLEPLGVPVYRSLPVLPTGGTRGHDPLLAARYLAALRSGARALRRGGLLPEADVAHANTAAAGIMCALAGAGGRGPARGARDRPANGSRPARTPLVLHLRDLVTAPSLGRFALAAFTRIALPRADAVIANSRSTLDSVRDRLADDLPTVVIASPIGIDARVTTPEVRPAVRVIGMLGRLQRWKGQHVVLRAFARGFGGSGVRLHIAGAPMFGESGYADELRGLAATLGIAEQVSFLGHVEDVAGFLGDVDVLVHASTRAEPLGQTVVQGLAYGKPVIATAGGGPGEWIRDGVNGLLVEPDDPEALAAALTRLAGSTQLRHRLVDGAARTGGILTDRECAAAHAAFFDELRRSHHRPEPGR